MGETIDTGLLAFATETQAAAIRAVNEAGSYRGAARLLGRDHKTIRQLVQRAKREAARRGHSPEHNWSGSTPPGFHAKGVSQLKKESDGSLTWYKYEADKEARFNAFQDAARDFAENYAGRAKPVPRPKHVAADVMNMFPLGDPHVGLRAWAPETGEDHDLDIGCRDMLVAGDLLAQAAPPAERAALVNLGDFFHAQDNTQLTPRGKNKLDVDGRHAKVARAGVHLMVGLTDKLLAKHNTVEVYNVPGNHDPELAVWIALFLEAWYRNEPRVVIKPAENPYQYIHFGENLIGVGHGDSTKRERLAAKMSNDEKELWGCTTFRYFYTGHIHHIFQQEVGGVLFESFRTIAAHDFYSHKSGYVSGQSLDVITHHAKYGLRRRERVTLEEIRDVQRAA